jgi:hypothetical protein
MSKWKGANNIEIKNSYTGYEEGYCEGGGELRIG